MFGCVICCVWVVRFVDLLCWFGLLLVCFWFCDFGFCVLALCFVYLVGFACCDFVWFMSLMGCVA